MQINYLANVAVQDIEYFRKRAELGFEQEMSSNKTQHVSEQMTEETATAIMKLITLDFSHVNQSQVIALIDHIMALSTPVLEHYAILLAESEQKERVLEENKHFITLQAEEIQKLSSLVIDLGDDLASAESSHRVLSEVSKSIIQRLEVQYEKLNKEYQTLKNAIQLALKTAE